MFSQNEDSNIILICFFESQTRKPKTWFHKYDYSSARWVGTGDTKYLFTQKSVDKISFEDKKSVSKKLVDKLRRNYLNRKQVTIQ